MVQVLNKSLGINILQDHISSNIYINKNSIDSQVKLILLQNSIVNPVNRKAWLLQVISVIDLTTLSGDDTRSNVFRLCRKAANPINPELMEKLSLQDEIRTAAVCVYPSRVADAYDFINKMGLTDTIQIASVSTGFPSGLYPIQSRLQEIKFAISKGATEIDVVLDRSLVLTGKWESLYDEVVQMRETCSKAHLKVILGTGELGSYENVYKAAMVSMIAGADFIKTSTGKETVNATLPIGLVMCRAIRNFYQMTGIKVGLKPAGGIKTADDAINWLILAYTELGPEWIRPELFRIGASSLINLVEENLKTCINPNADDKSI